MMPMTSTPIPRRRRSIYLTSPHAKSGDTGSLETSVVLSWWFSHGAFHFSARSAKCLGASACVHASVRGTHRHQEAAAAASKHVCVRGIWFARNQSHSGPMVPHVQLEVVGVVIVVEQPARGARRMRFEAQSDALKICPGRSTTAYFTDGLA